MYINMIFIYMYAHKFSSVAHVLILREGDTIIILYIYIYIYIYINMYICIYMHI
jgi:hypothetical protein